MKPLKYKIWDIPNKQWLGVPYALTQFGDLLCNNIVFTNMDDFEVCYSTNKNDIEGKEIYESHILEVEFNGRKRIHVVEWGNCEDGSDYYQGFNIPYHGEHCRIIGNIYENPELIKES